jgi:uncharacterized protein YndB with AHSA1/START domain
MKPDATLEVTTPSEREITMTRIFDAPPDLVFDAHTKPELVRRWLLGPDGWSMPVCEIDLRVGGVYRYVWRRDSDGSEMGASGIFREIERPARLVHTERFDEAWYPGEALITTTFTAEGERTRLTSTMLLESRAARDAVLKSGMESGVAAGYDRLARLLAPISNR